MISDHLGRPVAAHRPSCTATRARTCSYCGAELCVCVADGVCPEQTGREKAAQRRTTQAAPRVIHGGRCESIFLDRRCALLTTMHTLMREGYHTAGELVWTDEDARWYLEQQRINATRREDQPPG